MFVRGTSAVGIRNRSHSPATLKRSASNFGSCPVASSDARFTRYGGPTSRHPCARVCKSSMESVSARDNPELANLLRWLPVRFENRAGVFALPLCARNLIARRILIPLHPFELGNQSTTAILQRRKLLEFAVGVHTSVLQAAFHFLLMVAHVSGVKHCEIVCHRL